MLSKHLDLNIRKTLRHWTVSKALRELLANGLDEAKEVDVNIPQIKFKDGILTIHDEGRGIREIHFTQNENPNKAGNSDYIGKFGIGLKDAIATLYNKNKRITIESKHLYMDKTEMKQKHDCDEETLHIKLSKCKDKNFIGTTMTIYGINSQDVNEMRSYFPQYANLGPLIAQTIHGDIYERLPDCKTCSIYINGCKVNEEPNFMYHYDVRGDTKGIMRALSSDRDRNKITKTVYADKIQQILTHASKNSQHVRDDLLEQFDLDDDHVKYHELSYSCIRKLESELRANPTIEVEKQIKIIKKKKKKISEEIPIPPRVESKEEKLIESATVMLNKIFGDNIPTIKVGDDEDGNALYIKSKYLVDENTFKRRVMRLYLNYIQGDPDTCSSFLTKMVGLEDRL